MSLPALKWVSEIKVGNPHAKQLLQFLAVHNMDDMFFSISFLADQMEVSERTVYRAISFLEKNGFIRVDNRFDEKNNRQLTNSFYLLIPHKHKAYALGSKSLTDSQGGAVSRSRRECQSVTPYNNIVNNKDNKKQSEAKKQMPVDNFQHTHEEMQQALDRDIDLGKCYKKFREFHPGKFKRIIWERWFAKEKNGKKAKNPHLAKQMQEHEARKVHEMSGTGGSWQSIEAEPLY